MKEPITDHDIQLFFDAAEKMLNATERVGEKARTATVALSSFIEKAETRLQRLKMTLSAVCIVLQRLQQTGRQNS